MDEVDLCEEPCPVFGIPRFFISNVGWEGRGRRVHFVEVDSVFLIKIDTVLRRLHDLCQYDFAWLVFELLQFFVIREPFRTDKRDFA